MKHAQFLEIAKRLEALNSDKQALFRQKLAAQGINSWQLPIVPSKQHRYPLSLAQTRFLLAEQFSNRAMYNLCSVLAFDDGLDIKALQSALNAMIKRHQVMRTCFKQDEQANWYIQSLEDFSIELIPVEITTEQSVDDWLKTEFEREQQLRFDLTTQAPVRFSVFQYEQTNYLFVTMHHVAFDAWSFKPFSEELAFYYQAALNGQSHQLPPLDIQYQDYAQWQKQWLSSDDYERQQNYWAKQLADLPTSLNLPQDFTDKTAKARTFAGKVEQLLLDNATSEGLIQRTNEQGTTLFIHLQTAFSWVIAQYSGQQDFCFGSSIANRKRAELASMVGPLLNTLVMRHDLKNNPNFDDSIKRTQQVCAQAFDHQDYPYEQLPKLLGKDAQDSGLFQVMFIHVGMQGDNTITLPGTQGRIITPDNDDARFDMTMRVVQQDSHIALDLEYSSELFSSSTIKQMLADLNNVIKATLENPVMRLDQVTTRSPSLLDGDKLRTPHRLLTETVAEHKGDAIALSDGQTEINYQALNRLVDNIAYDIQKQGILQGQLVGLCMARNPSQVVAMLACWRLGVVCLMLDPRQPLERLNELARDAGAKLVLTLEPMGFDGVIEQQLSTQTNKDNTPNYPTVSLDDTAYMIYTSGSTGKPKGIMVSHRAVSHYAMALSQQLPQAQNSRWLTLATVSADLGLTSVLGALQQGQCLLMPPSDIMFDPNALSAFLVKYPADCLKITPSHLNALLSVEQPQSILPRKTLLLGGEGLSPELYHRLKQLSGSMTIINHYGPAEATVGITTNEMDAPQFELSPVASLGLPLPGNQITVRNEQGQIVPRGVIAELCVSSPQLAQGYWQLPEQTERVFRIDADGDRYYRTGDLVRIDRHGLLQYLGRADDQIKRRGYRVELGEITGWLNEQADVVNAIVLAKDIDARQQMVAWLQLHDDAKLERVQTKMKQALPDYTHPDHWIALEQMPLNANGKIDRNNLPLPGEQPNGQSLFSQQRTLSETEQQLATIWQQLLGIETIKPQDDFFTLGGDSIMSLQMIGLAARQGMKLTPMVIANRRTLEKIAATVEAPLSDTATTILAIMRQLLAKPTLGGQDNFYQNGGDSILSLQLIGLARQKHIQLTPKLLTEYPTAVALAKQLDSHNNAVPAPTADKIDHNQPQPLTLAQQRIWFIQQLDPNNTSYNLPALFEVSGDIDFTALKSACLELVERHHMLRTRYFEPDGKAQQQLVEIYQPLTVHHASANIESAFNRVFDLSQGQIIAIDIWPIAETKYQLLFNIHHIATDGWSMGLLIQDFAALYRHYQSAGKKPAPQKPATSYLDWAAAQAELKPLDKSLEPFWSARLADMPHTLALPTDKPYGAEQSYNGATKLWSFDNTQSQRIEKFAATMSATPFNVLLAAYQLLLWRYSGQNDFAIGIPVSGREQAQTQQMVGVFINTLVSRATIDPQMPLLDWLKTSIENSRKDLEHQQMPLEQLLEILQPARDMSRPAVFQVLFNYQSDKTAQRALELPGLTFTSIAEPQSTTKFELSFNLMWRDCLSVQIEYNTDLFESDTIDRLFSDYQAIVSAMLEQQNQPLNAVQLPSIKYSHLSGETGLITANDDFIYRFEQQVTKTPNAIAVIEPRNGHKQYSYETLNQDANRLAHQIIALGAGEDQLIAFCLNRSYKLLVTILAIQKAGAAYLPLDPTHPQQRLRYIAEHANASVCLFESATEAAVTELSLQTHDFDQLLSTAQTSDNPLQSFNPDALAYTLYTSGSTGKPKGVEVQRSNFAAFLEAIGDVVPSFSRLLALTTVTFDIAGLELCLPLVKGATVVMADELAQLESEMLSTIIERHQVDLVQATPATWRMLAEAPGQALDGVHAICGGEALEQSLAMRLQQQCLSLTNVYGPTETTVWSSYSVIEDCTHAVAPIGKPLMYNQLYVLNEQQYLVPQGAVGELYIGGATVARGYRHNGDLTDSVFIEHEQFGRLYRTGDLVKVLNDGQLAFIGRGDFQIKRHGFRIEPGDIESALRMHPAINEAVITLCEDNLVAYLTKAGSHNDLPNSHSLNDFLAQHVPAYMLPNIYQPVDKLPLNSNGKIDRKALPKITLEQSNQEHRGKTDKEQLLSEIWQSLLGKEQVSLTDNFFLLGGHSLLAGKLKARLNQAGFNLPLKALFEQPVLADQAQLMSDNKYHNIPMVTRTDSMPLSFAQNRLWFMQQMDLQDASFNMQTVVKIQGPLQLQAIRQALDALAKHHEILRVTYHQVDGEAVQRVNHNIQVPLNVIDLQAKQQDLNSLLVEAAQLPFDLANESSLRIYLYQQDSHTHYCQLVQHHIASDAWSMSILIDHLLLAYSQLMQQETVTLPSHQVDYLDYAHWQNTPEQAEQLQQGMDYWRTNLAGIPSQLALPFDHERDSSAKQGDALTFTLSETVTIRLKTLASQQQCSLFMLLMSAYSALLHRQTRAQDIVIGTDVANREHLQTEDMLGFFVNLIPLRMRPKPTMRFADYLQSVRQTCLDSFAHQAVPFEQIVEAVNPQRINGVHPLIQALLVMQNTPDTSQTVRDLTITSVDTQQHHSKFDMALFANESNNGELECNWVFNSQLFNKDSIENLSRQWQHLLEQVCDNPQQPLNTFTPYRENSKAMPDAKPLTSPKASSKKSKLSKLIKGKSSNKFADVTAARLNAERPFPLLVQCHSPTLDPLSWARSNQQQIMQWLESHGGIVFRGFNLPTAFEFEQFCVAMYPELYAMYGDLPKNDIGSKIYKSTPYPEDQMIMYHNESSHQHRWPRRQWFYCAVPSHTGGATPIVDCREMYRRLPQDIRQKLEDKQLCYIRNFTDLDVSWQHFFKTDSREEVEQLCQANDIDCHWYGEDNLKISQKCPAVISHPVTGEKSFFNQIQLHHFSFLENEVREHLLATGGEENLPRNVVYGDMSPIEQEVVDLISELYEACAVRFDWQKQDVVMVDNMLAAHARDPYKGERKIAVAMGDIYKNGPTPDSPPVKVNATETVTSELAVNPQEHA